MSEFVDKRTIQVVLKYREKHGHKGMIFIDDEKGEWIDWRLRYETNH